jgi:NAD(P)-dependent dehydrogenase (short-subunit alcohol dehydrogenase family)
MAERFAAEGWRVAGCGRSLSGLEALSGALGPAHFLTACNVADDSAVKAFATNVLEQFGPPDLVLNNAAVINPNAPLWEIDAEAFGQVMDVNIKGTASVMRHFLPAMLKAGRGVIVNFSSGWGRSTSAEVAPYCASKFAIEGLSHAAAQETGGKVAIIPLNPGIIDTDMLRSTFGESAGGYPDATAWAARAVPFLMKLGPRDNGKPLTAP